MGHKLVPYQTCYTVLFTINSPCFLDIIGNRRAKREGGWGGGGANTRNYSVGVVYSFIIDIVYVGLK